MVNRVLLMQLGMMRDSRVPRARAVGSTSDLVQRDTPARLALHLEIGAYNSTQQAEYRQVRDVPDDRRLMQQQPVERVHTSPYLPKPAYRMLGNELPMTEGV